ncbi:RNA polymerase sigma factor [Emergencia timonensis]|uniref:RNA polymerase sigma factor n=1 Tax=Emergencia timonensis TaxID=1776384 RepID=UPI003994C96B
MNDFEKLFEEYSDCIYRFCCNIADNLYEAEDLFQDTFLKAMEIEQKVMAADNTKCYLIGIALRLEKNNRRKKVRHKRMAPEARSVDQETDILEAIAMDEKA